MPTDQHSSRPLKRYLVASLPGWIVATIITVWLYRTTWVPAWAALLVLAVWIGTSVAMFPRVRRYYTSEPASRRMAGEQGVAVSPVNPRGFARVHGELWQVRTADPHASIPEGGGVRVREMDGLVLIVEPDPGRAAEWQVPPSSPPTRTS